MYAELRQAWDEFTGPGGPFEIVEVPVRGTRLRTYANSPGSLRDVWLGSSLHAQSDYLVYEDERWSYERAHRETAAIAAWLAERGVGPGDRVAIAMRNYPEWLLVYWAAVSMGATAVGMNAWWTGPEMAYAIEDSRPKVIVCDAERLQRLESQRDGLPPVVAVAARVPEAERGSAVPFSELVGHGGEMPEASIDPDSDACIFYTSGTTGRPKGAQLTHRGCTANLMSILFWNLVTVRARELAGEAPAQDSGGPARLCTLVTTPLFHVTANNCVAHTATAAGGALVLMYRWDPGQALRLIERERITMVTGVPTMARELLAHPDFERCDTSSLKFLGGGGAAFQPDLVDKIERRPGATRPNTGYGLTETCGIISTSAADYHVDKPESVGPVLPCYEAQCVDESGEPVAPGEPGELWVRGAQVIAGYLNRPEATAEAITDGWLRSEVLPRNANGKFLKRQLRDQLDPSEAL